jgi:antitoxin component YwqK of YwqJK toxin-antitoxin module
LTEKIKKRYFTLITKQVKKLIYISILALLPNILLAQEDVDPNSTDERFSISSPVTIDLDEREDYLEDVEVKKKKRKRKVFYGLKTKKRFTREGFGERMTYELFFVLKEPIELDTYVRDIYWYDYRRQEIRVGGKVDQKYGAILHGTYKKMQGDQVLKEGIFFKGMKHGRWMEYDKNDLLVDKEKYYKGWPRESQVIYYDREHDHMREIIPIEYGEREGNYYYFFEDGRVGVAGEYNWDNRVGDWVEYYPSGRRKKIIRYSKDAFDDEFRPFIWKEWNEKGKLVYEKR